MTPAHIAPMVVALLSDKAKDVSGQIFGSRMNEQFLFSQNRPIRSVQRSDGWTPSTILEHCLPAMKASFRSEEHTSELQSLMRISYAVFCLKKKKYTPKIHYNTYH